MQLRKRPQINMHEPVTPTGPFTATWLASDWRQRSSRATHLSKLTETLYFLSGSGLYADDVGLLDRGVDTTPLRWNPANSNKAACKRGSASVHRTSMVTTPLTGTYCKLGGTPLHCLQRRKDARHVEHPRDVWQTGPRDPSAEHQNVSFITQGAMCVGMRECISQQRTVTTHRAASERVPTSARLDSRLPVCGHSTRWTEQSLWLLELQHALFESLFVENKVGRILR